jgi:hypothetical protein
MLKKLECIQIILDDQLQSQQHNLFKNNMTTTIALKAGVRVILSVDN